MLFERKKRRITRLLIVEDEPLVAFDTEHMLREEGFVVVATTDSVAEAVMHIGSDTTIDLVLADMALADGSGAEVARAAAAAGIPVMLVTGQSPDALASLAIGCLSKPYPQRSLLQAIAAIEAVLDGKRPRRLPGSFRLFDEVR